MEMAFRRREQEVWQVLDDLWAVHGDAKSLTGEAIRDRLVTLGKSRGSPNEIYKYRKTWVHSRGISLGSNQALEEREHDPISRAVFVVHEKIKEETELQINEIKIAYEQQLHTKNNELAEMKQSINLMVQEYGELERLNNKIKKESSDLSELLSAEVAIRNASDRELALLKTRMLDEEKSSAKMLDEVKLAHGHHVLSLNQEHRQSLEKLSDHIKEVEQDKKTMGQEFSEQLNQLKITVLNQDIQNKNLEAKAALISSELDSMKNIVEALQQEKSALSCVLAEKNRDIDHLKIQIQAMKEDNKCQNHLIKKSHITIARLRTMLKAL